MLTVWNDKLATGNGEIDAMHKELFRKINDLHQACKEARGPEELGRLYWFLKRYVRKHFKDEETLQQTFGYYDYPRHKAAHETFIRDLRYLEIKYAQDGGSSTVIVKSLRMMSDWLRNHINQLDMELASFVREMTSLEYTEGD